MKEVAIAMCVGLMVANFAVAPRVATQAIPQTRVRPAARVVACVISVKGKVSVRRAGTKKFERLRSNTFLYEHDRIRTGKKSRARLALTSGAELRVNENSNLRVTEKGKVELVIGQVWTKLLHKMARLSVRTPIAVAAIQGTATALLHPPSVPQDSTAVFTPRSTGEADVKMGKLMTVKVYDGSADLMNEHGKQSLKARQISQVVNANSAPSAPRDIRPVEYETWQE